MNMRKILPHLVIKLFYFGIGKFVLVAALDEPLRDNFIKCALETVDVA